MIIRLPSHESHIVRENVEEDNFYVIVAPQLTAIPFCPSILLQQFNAAALSFKDGWEFWEVFSIYIKLKQKTRENKHFNNSSLRIPFYVSCLTTKEHRRDNLYCTKYKYDRIFKGEFQSKQNLIKRQCSCCIAVNWTSFCCLSAPNHREPQLYPRCILFM